MSVSAGEKADRAKVYCNVAARARGLDPVGYAGHFDDAVLIETPLPWKRNLYETAGPLPQEAIDLLSLWRSRYEQTGVYNHRPLLMAPDDDSAPGQRRLIHYVGPTESNTDPSTGFAGYIRTEYLAPEPEIGPLLWALFEDQAAAAHYERYRVAGDRDGRDLLVCTHGTIDVACAKFGYPLFDSTRTRHGREGLHVRRVSHFGGHVFAPTLIDMPAGHFWAYVGPEQADQIIARQGDVADLSTHYRGWAGLDRGFLQAAEHALWQKFGWEWFSFARRGEILDQEPAADDSQPRWADVSIRYTTPQGDSAEYTARVEVSHTVETRPSTDRTEPYAYPQYRTVNLARTPATTTIGTPVP